MKPTAGLLRWLLGQVSSFQPLSPAEASTEFPWGTQDCEQGPGWAQEHRDESSRDSPSPGAQPQVVTEPRRARADAAVLRTGFGVSPGCRCLWLPTSEHRIN